MWYSRMDLFTQGAKELSVLVNRKETSFFRYSRGVRQGYPLFSLLIWIGEDTLSRKFWHLVKQRHIHILLMAELQFQVILSLQIYLMIFCKATKRNTSAIYELLHEYAQNSSQHPSPTKWIFLEEVFQVLI